MYNSRTHPAAETFPLLEGDEYAALVESIASSGLHEPLWLAADGTLLDGRNRLRACHDAGVEPRWQTYTGDNHVDFIVGLNIHRRHLTPGQKALLALELLPHYEAEAAARTRGPAREKGEADRPHQIKRSPQSRDLAARAVGTSSKAVARAKRVVAAAPDLAAKVKTGTLAIDRAERIVRDRTAIANKVAEAHAAAGPERATIDIRHGDFRHVLADLHDIDAIITDPPYPAEHLPLLADLAEWADKVLAPDGILAVLIGQTHLPAVYELLSGHRPYRWTACYLTDGPGYVSHPRRVQSNWKPVLVYGGGPRFADVIRSTNSDAAAKTLHRWGQDYHAFHDLIGRLTRTGQTIADPFMGSATTLLAAHAQGRHVIGCDTDPDAVATSRERLQ